MAFCFKRKESFSKAIPRLGIERIEDALESLKHCGKAEAIHSARKDIKKVRALLRLVRAELNAKELRRVVKPLREAAKQLAGPRDAVVMVKTLRGVLSHFKGQVTPGALRHIRLDLRKSFESEIRRFTRKKNQKTMERVLRRASKELEELQVKGKGWKVIGPGVKAAYAKGKQAYQLAHEEPSPANFHQWRKRAKDLWYQVSLLHRVWPEQMEAIAGELETLGDQLGDHHDLVMLRQTVEEMCDARYPARELETLYGLVEERQRELQRVALAIGARFYAEKPSAFCKRLAEYWKNWRKEKKVEGKLVELTS